MPPRRAAALLALALAACGRGGEDPPGAGSGGQHWVGARDAARVDRVDPEGGATTRVASPPAIDAPVRALLPLSAGNVLVVQEPEVCDGGTMDPAGACTPAGALRRGVPPGVVLAPGDGHRVLALAALDPSGPGTLFTWAEPPWAAAQDPAGRVWVTGRTAPVVYGAAGAIALRPDPVPFPTRGVAALPDGRVAVSYGVQSLAVYRTDGTVEAQLDADLGPDLAGLDALLARADGTLLLASRRFGVSSAGVVIAGRLDPGALTLLVDPLLSATVGAGVPSALGLAGESLFTAPALGRLAAPECGRWLSADLRTGGACVAPAPHRGAAWVR